LKSSNLIRRRVLRGLALHRQPGLHFPGNFLDISFDKVAKNESRLSIAQGPWNTASDGQVDYGSLAILADLGLAACMRMNLGADGLARRLATVSMSLQFTGVRRVGRLKATGSFEGFIKDGAGKLGMSRVRVVGDEGLVCFGTGTFMALTPPKGVVLHPVPLRTHRSPDPARLRETDLSAYEMKIFSAAETALKKKNFIEGFWGGSRGVMKNGPHTGNRVGHAQGGLLVGFAAQTAMAALPKNWQLSGLTALYVSPGKGARLSCDARIAHKGGLTAVLNSQVLGDEKRLVLEVVTSHCALWPSRAD
jgi:acyl-coenzyme A thioesterase PaaI-like protein